MSVPPIRPVRVVRRTAHLRLNQVELRDVPTPIEIIYLFGQIPAGPRGLADLSAPEPRDVIVGELLGHFPRGTRQLYRNGSAPGYPYWGFQANFHCHQLSVTVMANAPKRLVRAIGRGVLQSEVCGK